MKDGEMALRRLPFAISSIGVLIGTIASADALVVPASAPTLNTPVCRADAVRLAVQAAGQPAGMSHHGAIVVVQNAGETLCALAAFPESALLDKNGKLVAHGVPVGARFMHRGPMISPILLAPGVEAAAPIRWISGNAFGANARSVVVTRIAMTVAGGAVAAPLRITLWRQASRAATFETQRYTTDLPPLRAASPVKAGTYVGEGPAGSLLTIAGRRARTVRIDRGVQGTFRFAFSGLGGRVPNLGAISGTLARTGTTASFRDRGADCALTLEAFGSQLVVNQTGRCGFGNGVTAAGRYRQSLRGEVVRWNSF